MLTDLEQAWALVELVLGDKVEKKSRRTHEKCPCVESDQGYSSGLTSRNRGHGFTALVFPGKQKPRYLIMLDPRLPLDPFRMYNPRKWLVRILRWGALIVAKTWYLRWLVGKTRFKGGTSVQQVIELAQGLPAVIGEVYLGPPGPTQKATAMAINALTGEILGFGKVGLTSGARAAVRKERANLLSLARTSAHGRGPVITGWKDAEQFTVLVTEAKAIVSQPWHLSEAHLDFLRAMETEDTATAGQHPGWQAVSENAEVFGRKYQQVIQWARSDGQARPLARVIVHGDFVPWNCGIGEQGLVAWDWEHSNMNGLPLWDAYHFIIQRDIIAGCKLNKIESNLDILGHNFIAYSAVERIKLLLAYLIGSSSLRIKEGFSRDDGIVLMRMALAKRVMAAGYGS